MQLVICSRTANGVLRVPALVPVEKHIVTWPKKDGDSSSHGSPVSRYYTCFLRRQCSPHCLPRERNTKHSGRQCICSKDGQGSQYQLCSECHYLWSAYSEAPKASTTVCCMFCHAVGCLSMHFQGQCWKCTRSPEIENNILNRPSAHVLFLVARRGGGVKLP